MPAPRRAEPGPEPARDLDSRHGRHPLPSRSLRGARSPSWSRTRARPGVERMLAIGMDRRLVPPRARGRRRARRGVRVGRAPSARVARASTTPALAELELLVEHPKARAIGETGLDYKRDYAPREDQRRAFIAQMELARAARLPLVIHTREAADGHARAARRHARRVAGDHPLLLAHRPSRRVHRARLLLLVRGQRHLSEGDRPAGGGRAGPGRAAAGRDRRAVPVAAGARAASRTSRRS